MTAKVNIGAIFLYFCVAIASVNFIYIIMFRATRKYEHLIKTDTLQDPAKITSYNIHSYILLYIHI